jgi:hypothetical protein
MEKKLLVSRIKTPDGTILTSCHVHDYVTYTDTIDGYEYMLDGGNHYQRYSIPEDKRFSDVDVSIYDDTPFEEIRKYFCRGGRGKDGNQPLKFVPLCEMSNAWLNATIAYMDDKGSDGSLYQREYDYRQQQGIIIEE